MKTSRKELLAISATLLIMSLTFGSVYASTPDFLHRHHSSSTTTTTTADTEMVGRVFGLASGCPTFPNIPNEITRIDQNFTARDSNGADAWELQFVQSDPSLNATTVMFFTSHNGSHTVGELEYVNGQVVFNQTIAVSLANGGTPTPNQPLNGDVIQGQFIDFYTGIGDQSDGGQVFWYKVHTTGGELFTYNMQNFPPLSQNFTVSSDSVRIVPLPNATSVTFTSPNGATILDTQLGQQVNSPFIPINSSFSSDPCATSVENAPITSANVCASLTSASEGNMTGITENWTIG